MMIPMFRVWDDHTEMVNRLEEEVKQIPGIINSLQESQELLGMVLETLFWLPN